MKIGILTFHEGLNHGAYLQAFATMRVLQGQGYEVEIINYKNHKHWLMEDIRPWRVYRRPVRFVDHWKKMRAFKRDQQKMALSPFTKNSEDVLKQHYDVVVVGSDVVWNYKIFGYDDPYFGGLNADRIVSYAPSFGWVDANEAVLSEVSEGLKRFDAISVRDENSRQIIENMMGIDPPVVLDPTLIYDFAGDAEPISCIDSSKPYLLVYAYAVNPDTIATVKAYAKKHGLQIVATGYRENWCDVNCMGAGPLEWLTLFQNAHTVLTSTFHGTVYALKNEKRFFFIPNKKAKNRVVSLLATCGIDHSFISDEGSGKTILIDPDYAQVNRLLHIETEKSVAWLKQAVLAK